MAKKSEAALAVIDPTAWPALVPEEREELLAAILENTDGAGLSPKDFDRVKVPTGGALYFNVKTPDAPDGEPMSELRGVILHRQMQRSYYEVPFDEGGGHDAPDCFCPDTTVGIGIGNPGGPCDECQFSKWTKSEDGNPDNDVPPPCGERHDLMVLMQGDVLPRIISIPRASLQPLKKYLASLSVASLRRNAVETVISLEKAQGGKSGKIDYAKVNFAVGRRLPKEMADSVKEYAADFVKQAKEAGQRRLAAG